MMPRSCESTTLSSVVPLPTSCHGVAASGRFHTLYLTTWTLWAVMLTVRGFVWSIATVRGGSVEAGGISSPLSIDGRLGRRRRDARPLGRRLGWLGRNERGARRGRRLERRPGVRRRTARRLGKGSPAGRLGRPPRPALLSLGLH